MSPTPLLSCLTALGRPEFDYLKQASASLEALAVRFDLEWVVACDGLDAALVAEAVDRFPVRPLVLPAPEAGHTSAGEARNRALAASSGDLILTLDSDDFYAPGAMSILIDSVLETGAGFGAGLAYDVTPAGEFLAPPPRSDLTGGVVAAGAFYEHWQSTGHWPWHPSATVARRDLIDQAGGWPGRGPLRDDEDTFLWSTISRLSPGLLLRMPVMAYRVHPASLTHQDHYSPGALSFEAAWDRSAA